MHSFIIYKTVILCRAQEGIKTSILLQIDGGFSVETLVLPFHVGETCEVIGVNKGQIDLRGEKKSKAERQLPQEQLKSHPSAFYKP